MKSIKSASGAGRRAPRILALLLAAVLAAGLGACAGPEEPAGTTDSTMEAVAAAPLDSTGEATFQTGEAAEGRASEGLTLGTGLLESVSEESFDPEREVKITRSARPVRRIQKQDVYGNLLPVEFYFHRATLSKAEQSLYDQMYANALDVDRTFNVSVKVHKDRLVDIFNAVRYDNPDLFWVQHTYSYTYDKNGNVSSVTLDFFDCVNRLDEFKQAFYDRTNSALEGAMALSNDVERVKFVHDILTNINDYEFGYMNQSAYSAVCYGKTVCMGYASAFTYYMQRLGIPCATVNGDAGGSHVWNIVLLDGEFYAVDVTWDDPVGNPATYYYYNYFNINDGIISKTHTRRAPGSALPAATGTGYTFASYFGGNRFGSDFTGIDYGKPKTVLPAVYPGKNDIVNENVPYAGPGDTGPVDIELEDLYSEYFSWSDEEWDEAWDLLERELDADALAAAEEMDWEDFFALITDVLGE